MPIAHSAAFVSGSKKSAKIRHTELFVIAENDYPYSHTFLNNYSRLIKADKEAITLLPLSWFIYWFSQQQNIKRYSLQYTNNYEPIDMCYDYLRIQLTNRRNGNLLINIEDVTIDPYKVERNFKFIYEYYVSTFDDIEEIVNIFNYNEGNINDIWNRYNYKITGHHICKGHIYKYQSYMIIDDSEPTNDTLQAGWIIKENLPFCLLIEPDPDFTNIFKYVVIHRYFYENFIMLHMDILKSLSQKHWDDKKLIEYANNNFQITEFIDKKSLADKLWGIFNSSRILNYMEAINHS